MLHFPELPPKARTIIEGFLNTLRLPNEVSRTPCCPRIAAGFRERRLKEFETLSSTPPQGLPEVTVSHNEGVREIIERPNGSFQGAFTYTRITEIGSYVVGLTTPDKQGKRASFALYLTAEGGFLAQGRS